MTDFTPISAADPPRPLAGTRFRVEVVTETGSTNADLLAAAQAGAEPGLARVADHQTAGRGRRDRHWTSAPGASLLVSVLLEPIAPEVLQRLIGATALAMVEAIESLTGVESRIKWPNDLVVHDRKLAGVLAESAVEDAVVRAVVVGIGVNLAPAAIAPDDAPFSADLATLSGAACDRDALLDAFLRRLDRRLDVLAEVIPDLAARSATLGRRVLVEQVDRAIVGVATGLEANGALVVTDHDGDEYEILAGDVVHLRHDD